MIVRPISVKQAARFCARVHRRHPAIQGGLWALGLFDEGGADVLGIGIVGVPPRLLQRRFERLCVTRVAVVDLPRVGEHANSGCSMLYGAAARTARAMGATDLLTYTHVDEPGSSLRGAGWVWDGHITDDEAHDRPSRSRSTAKSGRKKRWWASWSSLLPGYLEASRAAGGVLDVVRQRSLAL